jgi:hypothetical protein
MRRERGAPCKLAVPSAADGSRSHSDLRQAHAGAAFGRRSKAPHFACTFCCSQLGTDRFIDIIDCRPAVRSGTAFILCHPIKLHRPSSRILMQASMLQEEAGLLPLGIVVARR